VSAWRREAIAAFPELRTQLNRVQEIGSPYDLWFELLPLVVEAHRDGNDDLLRRIYGYAQWSRRQTWDLENAVAVAFYEHLFDQRWMRPLVPSWLSRDIIEDIRPLWESRLPADEMREVEKLLRT
jgi:hypothetical protein